MKNSGVSARGRDIPFVGPALNLMPEMFARGVISVVKDQVDRSGGKVIQGVLTYDCTGFPVLNPLKGADGCAPIAGSAIFAQLTITAGVPGLLTTQPSFPLMGLSGAAAFSSSLVRNPCELGDRIELLDSVGNLWGLDGVLRSTGNTPCATRSSHYVRASGTGDGFASDYEAETTYWHFDNGDIGIGPEAGAVPVWPGGATILANANNALGPAQAYGFGGEIGFNTPGYTETGTHGFSFVRGGCAATGCGGTKNDDFCFSVEAPKIGNDTFGNYGVMVRRVAEVGGFEGMPVAFAYLPAPYPAGNVTEPGPDMHIFAGEEGSVYAMKTGVGSGGVIYRYRFDRATLKLALVKKITLALATGDAWDANTIVAATLAAV